MVLVTQMREAGRKWKGYTPDDHCEFCKYCDVEHGYRGKEIPPLSGSYLYLQDGTTYIWRFGKGIHDAVEFHYCPMCGRKFPEGKRRDKTHNYLRLEYKEGSKRYEAKESIHDTWQSQNFSKKQKRG